MPLPAGRLGLATVPITTTRKGISEMRLSHTPARDLGGVRRPESGVVGGAGPGDGVGRAGRARRAGRRAPERAGRQGRERRVEGGLAGRGDGRRRGLDRRHGAAAARRDGPGVRPDLRPVDVGVVPAGVHLRPRPPARRGRLPVPARTGRPHQPAQPQQIAHGDGERRGYVLVDVDDTIIEVHGHAKQGAGFGYSRVRGLNALLATVTTRRRRRR